jgi:hypothetical protein
LCKKQKTKNKKKKKKAYQLSPADAALPKAEETAMSTSLFLWFLA